MCQYITHRSRAVIVVVLVLIAGSISTMSVAHANGYTDMPSTTSTPSASPTSTGKPTGPTPKFIANISNTGQYSRGATSNAFCNNTLYTAWTGADDHVNVAWGFNGSGFDHQVAYADLAFYDLNTNPSTYTRPVLACWAAPNDIYRLWIFFTGTNQVLYLGFYEPGDENQDWETVHTHYYNDPKGNPQQHIAVPNQSSNRSPALAPYGGTLRIGWVGDGNGYLNFESFNGSSFFSINIDSDSTADAGFGMTVWCKGSPTVCKVWIAYPGTDNPHHIYVEDFNLSSGAWENSEHGHPTNDFTGPLDDLTLVLQSGTLRVPYAGNDIAQLLNIDNSTDGQNWSNDPGNASAFWGAGAAIDSNNHFWVTFPNILWFNENPIQIAIFQYN